MLGVDVSFWRGFPDWGRAKETVDFALLAVTERFEGIDKTFEHNYRGCKENGIKVGVYSYSYAVSGDDSARYARMVVDQLRGKEIDLPVFLDMEWEEQESYPQSRINDIILRFKEVVEEAGYTFGIYCNGEWYHHWIPDFAKECPVWYSWPVTTGNAFNENLKPPIKNMVCWQYSFGGTVPGIGTDEVDMDIWYGAEVQQGTTVTAEDALNVIRGWLGATQGDATHKAIIDIYNNHKPLAQGYRLSYTDSWCDATVSAVFICLDATDLIGGTECGVERHVELFKRAGIWDEDGTIIPGAGDIIVFNWDSDVQPNNGFSDHIGLVEYVEGSIIHTIEGNAGGQVRRRTYQVGEGCIRGYAKPRYAQETAERPVKPSEDEGQGSVRPAPETPLESPYDMPELSRGSTGVAVMDLQRELNALNKAGLDVDGIFGPATQMAVMSYQTWNGLYPDGIVGPLTWAKLTNQIIARAVISGDYGNGEERREKLTAEGYDYQAVQAEVNKMLG